MRWVAAVEKPRALKCANTVRCDMFIKDYLLMHKAPSGAA
jgi:hypothetical protein